MATPRPSLKDPKKWSATSSNFTYVGHKEDSVVKMISETLASRLRTNIVVVAGIHWDNIKPEEIEIIQELTHKLADRILNRYGRLK
jgi:succinylglutamate desuccinylase